MKLKSYAVRNAKEMLRDPFSMAFGIGFPLVLLLLLTLIQQNIPVNMFELDRLTPGVAVFGLSFIALFSGTIIAKDRSTSFMLRMFTSPMTAKDYILGYTLPLLPMSVAQMAVSFLAALVLGLEPSVRILVSIAVSIPAALVYIGLGLLCGSALNDKQVGGVCGALLTNGSAWLSGTWFDLELVGGGFAKIARALPFCHAVDAGRYALSGEYGKIMPELWWVIGYAVISMAAAGLVFTGKMNGDQR